MASAGSFLELVGHLCKRRHMYVAGGTFYEVCAYLSGYAAASPQCPLGGEGWAAFSGFVCATFGFPSKYVWPFVLKQCSRNDEEAVTLLRDLLERFTEGTETKSYEEIIREALSRASDHEAQEPVRAWRRFSRAIHRARREEIEPLIQDHRNANVLWSATYPDDVALLLDQIQESQSVRLISGSEDDGEVTIITPDFGPVNVKRIGGNWRIDASKIIACWGANSEANDQGPTADSRP